MANNTRNYGLTLASKTKGVTVLSSEEKEIGTPLQENLKDKALIDRGTYDVKGFPYAGTLYFVHSDRR